jgi:hypothetical protein
MKEIIKGKNLSRLDLHLKLLKYNEFQSDTCESTSRNFFSKCQKINKPICISFLLWEIVYALH